MVLGNLMADEEETSLSSLLNFCIVNTLIICISCMQTDEERQHALQAFSAQSAFSSSGSGSSLGPLPSPTSHTESRSKVRKGPRKNQNEKYRLKYIRLRKAARAMIFVSKLKSFWDINVVLKLKLVPFDSQENAALYDEIAHLEEKFVRAKEERRYVHMQLFFVTLFLNYLLKLKFRLLNQIILTMRCTEKSLSRFVFDKCFIFLI